MHRKWNQNLLFGVIYFVIAFYGSLLFLEHQFKEQHLPVAYALLIGFTSAVVSGIAVYIVKSKSPLVKIFIAVLLLIFVLLLSAFTKGSFPFIHTPVSISKTQRPQMQLGTHFCLTA